MRRPASLNVHIDHLVVELPSGASGRQQLQAALAAELSRLFGQHYQTGNGGTVRSIAVKSPGLSQAATPARAGEAIAESIHRLVTGAR